MAEKIEDIVKEIENRPEFQKLPEPAKKLIKNSLERINMVPFPIITIKENDWILASTPILDLSAQGKTDEEAVKNLEAMIEDYMTDPDTRKPEIKAMMKMQISMKNIPVKLQLNELQAVGSNSGKNP